MRPREGAATLRGGDGGKVRQYGWGRLPTEMGDVKTGGTAQIASSVSLLRLYNRPLRTSEAIANFHAGCP